MILKFILIREPKVKSQSTFKMSLKYYKNKDLMEVGVDEVARGCLLGRVYAAAVIWPKTDPDADPEETFSHPPVRDSKTLSAKQREELKDYIEFKAIDFAVAYADEKEIDKYNILQASQLAMHRALDQVRSHLDFDHILADGNYFQPYYTYTHDCIPQGDNKYYSIAAASILAKVYHDEYIRELVVKHPELEDYGIDSNMGYGAPVHLEGIKKYGITPFHRRSFKTCTGVAFRKKNLPPQPRPPPAPKKPKEPKVITKIVKKKISNKDKVEEKLKALREAKKVTSSQTSSETTS